MLCEWYSAPCTPPPHGVRTTIGQLQSPSERYLMRAASDTIWSNAGWMKSANWISATGRRPCRAMPIATPTMEDSASGVSITRISPNSSKNPAVTRNTPPRAPTSSPRIRTRSSACISSWRVSWMVWTTFFSVTWTSSSHRHPRRCRATEDGFRGAVDVLPGGGPVADGDPQGMASPPRGATGPARPVLLDRGDDVRRAPVRGPIVVTGCSEADQDLVEHDLVEDAEAGRRIEPFRHAAGQRAAPVHQLGHPGSTQG